MDQMTQRVAQAYLERQQEPLSRFVRRWGREVSYIRDTDGTVSIRSRSGSEAPPEAAEQFKKVASAFQKDAYKHPRFTRNLKPSNARHWRWDKDILEAKNLAGSKMQKFSWNPVTGEFMLVWPGQNHASVKGAKPFDDYVRGILLPDRKLVMFRPFYPTWMQKLSPMQQFHGGGSDPAQVSFDAQHAAEQALKASGSKGWKFQYNIDNVALEKMTGEHVW